MIHTQGKDMLPFPFQIHILFYPSIRDHRLPHGTQEAHWLPSSSCLY